MLTKQEILDLINANIADNGQRRISASKLRQVLQSINDAFYNKVDDDVLTDEELPAGVLPPGGTNGQVLKKTSDNDYEVTWANDDAGTTITETAQATIESPINTEADKFVSARRFWQGIAYFLTQSWTWTLRQIFLVAPRLNSSAGSRLQWTNATKDLADATVRNALTLDGSGNLELGGALTKNTFVTGAFNIDYGTSSVNIGNIQEYLATFRGFRVGSSSIYTQFSMNPTGHSFIATDATNSTSVLLNRNGDISISNNKAGTVREYRLNGSDGLKEFTDYTASYTDRSLVAKSYVDSLVQGIKTKAPVAVLVITNITLSGLQTLQGVTGVAGLRVAVTGQTTATQNGIYEMQSGAWNRATDTDIASELISATFLVEGGTYANTTWRVATNPITLGSTNISIVQVQGTIASATETSAGIAELLTQAEAEAGTDNERIATILRVSQWFQTKSNAANGYAGLDGNGLLTWALIMPDVLLTTLPANLTFTQVTQIGTYDAPINDLAFPAPSYTGAKRGMTTIIFHKRVDTQVPYFSNADYKNMGANYVPQALNIIFVKYDGAKCLVTSISEVVLLGASGLSIASTFNFGAYPNFLEGDVLTGQATAVNPSWNWLSATDSAGAGQATLNSLQAYTVVGNENFITFRVKGRQGMFDGQFVTLTPFKPTKAITEDTNWNSDFWFDNNRFTRSTGNTNAPTKITGAGVGFSGNHVSIVSSTTGASKLYIAIGGTVANQPQIPVSAQFYFFEVEIWCNADKDLRFRMDDNELFQEWYQDGAYGAAVTPPTFRAFNAVVTKRIIVRNNQNTSNSRFAVETTGTGTTGDEIRVNIKRAGLISA